MPNHITNRLEIIATKDQLKEIFLRYNTHHPAHLSKAHDGDIICYNEKRSVGWFNEKTGVFTRRGEPNSIGLPEGYSFEISPSIDQFPDFAKVIPPPDCDEYKDIPNQDACKDSPNWWYTWNIANWGSKWGAYSYSKESENIFLWETAWSSSETIIDAISEAFPGIEMIYEYADEDTGANTGRIHYSTAGKDSFYPDNHSTEAFSIAFKLMPERGEDYKLVNGKYEYIDRD